MESTNDYRLSHLQRGESYDAYIAETPFDAYMAEWERQHLARIVGKLFPAGVPRYLDFACGTGRATATVAPFCRESVGVDISPAMIEVAKKRLPATAFHLGDLTRDPLDLGAFDLITSFRFFGNAQDELREDALKALVARLSPAGYLVINNHRNPRALYALFDRLTGGETGAMDLHMSKFRRLLRRHGLEVRQSKPIGAWMYRSRLMGGFRADDPIAISRESRYGQGFLSAIAPDIIVVAQRA